MSIQELGYTIRQGRLERGLTQAQLSQEVGLSRTTLNQLENGVAPDIGVNKIIAILKYMGRNLKVMKAAHQAPDFVRMAKISANVSYKNTLTEEELVQSLLKGKVTFDKRPHFRALLEEAPPSVVEGLVDQVSQWTHKPQKVRKNLEKIATELGGSKELKRWMTHA